MANGPGPLEKAMKQRFADTDFEASIGPMNPKTLGNPQGKPDVLVACRGCGVVFVRSKVAKGEGAVAVNPNDKEVICPATTCPCCLQTQGWSELADVRFRSVDTP